MDPGRQGQASETLLLLRPTPFSQPINKTFTRHWQSHSDVPTWNPRSSGASSAGFTYHRHATTMNLDHDDVVGAECILTAKLSSGGKVLFGAKISKTVNLDSWWDTYKKKVDRAKSGNLGPYPNSLAEDDAQVQDLFGSPRQNHTGDTRMCSFTRAWVRPDTPARLFGCLVPSQSPEISR